MEKTPPYLFDNLKFTDCDKTVFTQNGDKAHLAKVRVFSKYENRNGSYITDAIADELIKSAIDVPVVGQFDHSTEDWTGHVGPGLASAYGYCKEFLGWEPYMDDDGITREYAVFSVVLFSDYFEEAKKIIGKSQSMELDKKSITGSWKKPNDGNYEVYVYDTAKMLGFCLLGDDRTPCFSQSRFFEKNNLETRIDNLTNVVSSLQDSFQKYFNGGKDAMEEVKQETSVEVTEEVFTETEPTAETQVEAPAEAEASAPTESEEVKEEEEISAAESAVEETSEESAAENTVVEESATEPAAEEVPNFEDKYNELLETYNALQTQYDALVEQHKTLQEDYNKTSEEKEVADQLYEAVKQDLASKEETISKYSERIQKYEQEEKEELIKKFSKCLPAPVMQEVNDAMANMTLDELNTRLAMEYTSFSMAKEQDEEIRVPQVPKESNAFAQLLSKYKK